jgi:DNA-binding transcriptional MocR family regulator
VQVFSPSQAPGHFVRAAFSMVNEEQIDTAMSRLATLLREDQAQ